MVGRGSSAGLNYGENGGHKVLHSIAPIVDTFTTLLPRIVIKPLTKKPHAAG